MDGEEDFVYIYFFIQRPFWEKQCGIEGQIDGRTDRQTDGQKDGRLAIMYVDERDAGPSRN
jgi:hypothetical protein